MHDANPRNAERHYAKEAFGGPEGIRTPGLVSAIHALSQLSYGPTAVAPSAERGVYPRSYTRLSMASLFKRKIVPEGVDPARIPPGQTLTAPDRWPLLHFGPV